MNWFQIVFLREDSQVRKWNLKQFHCCELISNCIFTWGLTRQDDNGTLYGVLWIDFKLYFYVRTHKKSNFKRWYFAVVNWFQIVFLREDSQDEIYNYKAKSSCELISNCIFTWGLTSYYYQTIRKHSLWIDFKLYFYVRTHKVNPAVLSKINTSGFLFELKKHQHPKFKMIDLDGFLVLIKLKQL